MTETYLYQCPRQTCRQYRHVVTLTDPGAFRRATGQPIRCEACGSVLLLKRVDRKEDA